MVSSRVKRKLRKLMQKVSEKKQQLKKQLKPKLQKAKEFLKNLFTFIGYAVVFFMLSSLTILVPSVYEDYLLNKVRASTVKITLLLNPKHGGTGFAMNLNNKSYLVTNAHVCRALGQSGLAAVYSTTQVEPRISRVLKISDTADLCLMSGFDDIPTLELGEEPDIGDKVIVAGHPYLQPTTPNIGRIVAEQFALVPDDPSNCQPKYGSSVIQDSLFAMFGCIRAYNIYLTTLTIHPGNSGSPVINVFGKVISVVFASNQITNDGVLVTWSDLKDFLEEIKK